MKRFLSILLSLIIIFTCGGCGNAALIPLSKAYCIQYNKVDYTYDDMDMLVEIIKELNSDADAAHQMAEAARQLGYRDNHEIIALAKNEYIKAFKLLKDYQDIYNNLLERWHQKEEEYPVATYIWSYLKDLGYSNEVCSGILGNIMAEVGGNTLDIQYWLQSSDYYGMCQWNIQYYPEIYGGTLLDQCNYLRDTIEYEIDTFGWCYQYDCNYSAFCELTSIIDAALCFAKTYERCEASNYSARKENAIVAYNYFIS